MGTSTTGQVVSVRIRPEGIKRLDELKIATGLGSRGAVLRKLIDLVEPEPSHSMFRLRGKKATAAGKGREKEAGLR